jgi:hypothetical protein
VSKGFDLLESIESELRYLLVLVSCTSGGIINVDAKYSPDTRRLVIHELERTYLFQTSASFY